MASYLSSVAAGVWNPLKGLRTAAAQPCLDSRPFASDRRRSPAALMSEDDALSFCSSLYLELRALERLLGEGPVSLRWSAEAMRVLKRTQAKLLDLLRKTPGPTSFEAKEGWFDLYMEETAVLLDLCNHLRSVTSGISNYRMVVDLAIHRVEGGSAKDLEALELEHHKHLEATGRSETTTTATPENATPPPPTEQTRRDKSAAGVATHAAKCATVAISLILVSAFTSPVPIDVDEEHITRGFPQLAPLADSLASLAGRFRESRRPGASGALAEPELVRAAVGELRRQLEEEKAEDGESLSSSVELLRQRSVDLKEGIEAFDGAVDEVFDEMIKGRNELLGAFRDGAL